MSVRYLRAEPLEVKPELVGQELASPRRRFFALAMDLILVWPPTLIVALSWVILAMWVQDRPALGALIHMMRHEKEAPAARLETLGKLAPLLVRLHADGLPREAEEALAAGDRKRAAEIIDTKELMIAFNLEEHPATPSVPPGQKEFIRVPLERLIPSGLRGVAAYGVAAIYFALFAWGRRGATLGKRILGIRIVRLDGHRLNLWEGFERFVGYLHIPGTLGIGLVDLWHDPNRRMAHDRVVHTVVVRVRKPKIMPPMETTKRESETESNNQPDSENQPAQKSISGE
jgi:hypothetical protein